MRLAEIAKENAENRLYLHQYALSAETTITTRFTTFHFIGIRLCQHREAEPCGRTIEAEKFNLQLEYLEVKKWLELT